jgi:hypothetical protein
MADLVREDCVRIVKEIEKAIGNESYNVVESFQTWLNGSSILDSEKWQINSAIKEILNKSLSFVFRILDDKMMSNVFQDFHEHFVEENIEKVDEQDFQEFQDLQEQFNRETERRKLLAYDIQAGKSHIKELTSYINLINSSESQTLEESLQKYLKSNY